MTSFHRTERKRGEAVGQGAMLLPPEIDHDHAHGRDHEDLEVEIGYANVTVAAGVISLLLLADMIETEGKPHRIRTGNKSIG